MGGLKLFDAMRKGIQMIVTVVRKLFSGVNNFLYSRKKLVKYKLMCTQTGFPCWTDEKRANFHCSLLVFCRKSCKEGCTIEYFQTRLFDEQNLVDFLFQVIMFTGFGKVIKGWLDITQKFTRLLRKLVLIIILLI